MRPPVPPGCWPCTVPHPPSCPVLSPAAARAPRRRGPPRPPGGRGAYAGPAEPAARGSPHPGPRRLPRGPGDGPRGVLATASSRTSSTSTMRSLSGTSASRAPSSVVFPLPVPPVIRRETRHSTRRAAARRFRRRTCPWPAGPQPRAGLARHAKAQVGSPVHDRRQHGVQADAAGKQPVHPRLALVEPPPRLASQSHREPSRRLWTEAGLGHPLEATTPVDPDRAVAVDEDVGDAGVGEMRLEGPAPEQVSGQLRAGQVGARAAQPERLGLHHLSEARRIGASPRRIRSLMPVPMLIRRPQPRTSARTAARRR